MACPGIGENQREHDLGMVAPEMERDDAVVHESP
jgi:hypothetical protein